MRKGDMCLLTMPDPVSRQLLRDGHGYLWVCVNVSDITYPSRSWRRLTCKSLATGAEAFFHESELQLQDPNKEQTND